MAIVKKVKTWPYQRIHHFYRTCLLILFLAEIVFALLGLREIKVDNFYLAFVYIIGLYSSLFLMVQVGKVISTVIRDILMSDIDLEKYRLLIEYMYRKSYTFQKRLTLQESYIADGQYHYFRGDFQQSIKFLDKVDIKKVAINRRKKIDETKAYYFLANAIKLKDFSSIEEEIELFSRRKGKNVEQLTEKLQAMHTVVSGEVTDYFQMEKPKYKLFQIEAAYFQGLNLLNQDKQAEAKECFASIVSENPDLFYVKEAKRYVEELS